VGGSRHAELLGKIDIAAPRATSCIAGVADQGFEGMFARDAAVLVDRHGGEKLHEFPFGLHAFWKGYEGLSMLG
jgi:hypothetical protein